jgi:hypothetical protein
MIGVKRNSVSLVAHILQSASLIKYTRGHIKILNIDGLRDISCECYAAVNAQHLRLLNNA